MKKAINEVVVVEGKTDTIKLQKLFDVQTIETNGSALNQETINLIKLVAKKQGVILFLDPDYPGETIRKKLSNELIEFKQAFIKKTDMHKNAKKIGIAEATNEAIINAIEHVATYKKNMTNSLS